MMRELTSLWASVNDPEYLHLLLEPLPLFGLGIGLLFLITSVTMKQPQTRILALVVIILSAASVHWYLGMRVKSEPRIMAMMDVAFHPLIRKQTELRQSSAWLYYTVASAGIVGLAASRTKRATLINGITMVVVASGFVHSVWLHKKECEIYHRNIVRYVPPK